jgi:hypothetical protein
MKIEVDEERNIILKQVYNGVGFISPDGEKFNICMRDGGYEFSYQGAWFRAVGGKIEPMSISTENSINTNDEGAQWYFG